VFKGGGNRYSGQGSFGPGIGGPGGFPRPGGGSNFGGSGGSGSGSFGPSGGPQIPIVSFDAQNGGDGNYRYSYETGNGIQVQEQGQTQGKIVEYRRIRRLLTPFQIDLRNIL
jgi:hypothetical protein